MKFEGAGRRPGEFDWALGTLGLMALVGFLAVFVNIPWEWSMFMDDTLYNTWMPNTQDLWQTIRSEVASYWALGRFYPVKYLANILKWRYLPNDPSVFRQFNLMVFLVAAFFSTWAAIKPALEGERRPYAPLFLFLLGSVFLHKPLLETISLNPLGETWVFLFFSLGTFCLFSENRVSSLFLARFFFVLTALSKEPAALVFFASAARYFYLGWRSREGSRFNLVNGVVDLLFFAFFLLLAMQVMAQGSFTRGAYFATTPWGRYLGDFVYKVFRYCLWTSPFIFLFLIRYRSLLGIAKAANARAGAAALFFLVMGGGYLCFMSTQGIVAYQEIPAAMAFFGLFALITYWLYRRQEALAGVGALIFILLFCGSYFVSVTRWERFVRGIVEPRRAMVNLLATKGAMTVVVPVGEISGHIQQLTKEFGAAAKSFELGPNLAAQSAQFRGRIYLFEFPIYMGPLDPAMLRAAEELAGGWDEVIDGKSYRIYRGKKEFP